MLMRCLYRHLYYRFHTFFAYKGNKGKEFVYRGVSYKFIGVGSSVARSTLSGNAKASMRGTGNGMWFHAFLYSPYTLCINSIKDRYIFKFTDNLHNGYEQNKENAHRPVHKGTAWSTGTYHRMAGPPAWLPSQQPLQTLRQAHHRHGNPATNMQNNGLRLFPTIHRRNK